MFADQHYEIESGKARDVQEFLEWHTWGFRYLENFYQYFKQGIYPNSFSLKLWAWKEYMYDNDNSDANLVDLHLHIQPVCENMSIEELRVGDNLLRQWRGNQDAGQNYLIGITGIQTNWKLVLDKK